MIPPPLTGRAFDECLAELRPRIGHYGWILALLRQRYRKHGTGGFPHRVYGMLKRFFNSQKPYFVAVSAEGVKFVGDIRDDYSVLCAIAPDFDKVITRFLATRVLAPGAAYLDVGTNLGLVASMVALKLGSDHPVFAFEPSPETARRAAATFALNQLHRVRLFQAAVGDVEGELDFFQAEGRSASSTAAPEDPSAGDLHKVRVPVVTLDRLAESGALPSVGLIKLDVEGFEPRAIQGSLHLIARDRPHILFEYAPGIARKLGWDAQEIVRAITLQAPYEFQVLAYEEELRPMPPPEDYFSNVYCRPV